MRPKLILLGLVPLLLSGCSFVFSHGPPAGHEQMESFQCTESNAAPTIDIVWGSLNVLGALGAAADPRAYANSGEIVAVGLGWGVLSSFAAASGFSKSKQCRQALQQLAVRNAQRRAGLAALPIDLPSAVVVSPSDDTLAVGGQRQLVANAHSSSGTVMPNRSFMWSSSNDAIASVSNAGLVTAHAVGTVVIAANTGNVVGTARIMVTAQR